MDKVLQSGSLWPKSHSDTYIYIYIVEMSIYIQINTYIYIYMEGEREREDHLICCSTHLKLGNRTSHFGRRQGVESIESV